MVKNILISVIVTLFNLCINFNGFAFFSGEKATSEAKQSPKSIEQIRYSFAPIVNKIAPSVVNIYTKKKIHIGSFSPFRHDPFFSFFFDHHEPRGQYREQLENALGSGVIISDSGTIITNNHVIDLATDIVVVFQDQSSCEANLIAADKKQDLALLECKDKEIAKFSHINFADSDKVEVGDLVLAAGNPFGVGQTVTSGIVSGLARSTSGIGGEYYIQTDASINPGNSGGALVDINGDLVGINTLIFSRSGGSHGIGFAIPSNRIKAFINNINHAEGRVINPWLGAVVKDLESDAAEALGVQTGVIISSIRNMSPLEKLAIKEGDVITKINNHIITNVSDFEYRLSLVPLNSEIEIEYINQQQIRRIKVKVGDAPQVPAPDYHQISGQNVLSGAELANLSPFFEEKFNINLMEMPKLLATHSNLIVITKIENNSHSFHFGLKPGDLIININGKKLSNPSQASKLLKSGQNQFNSIDILRKSTLIKLRG